MSYAPFEVSVSNVSGSLFDGVATLLSVPSVLGTTTILAHHEPLIALLKEGTVRIVDGEGAEHEYHITKGLLEVSHNKAIVLV